MATACCRAASRESIESIHSSVVHPQKRSFAFGHLPQKEKQNILPSIRADARIVERVVQWPNQPVEIRSEVHGSPIAIEPVRFRIPRKHVRFN